MQSKRIRLALCVCATTLSACAHRPVLSDDFGVAYRQDVAAQIANPDARYVGIPTPGSNGVRAGLAQTRYQRDEVTPPSSLETTSTMSVTGGMMGNEAPAASASASGQ